MGLEFLARVRTASLWLGGLAALVASTYGGPSSGLSLAAGAAWSLVNLALLQLLIVALTGRDRETNRAALRAWGAGAGTLAWFGAGAFLLAHLRPLWLLVGFVLPFAVMIAKAGSLLLVGSRLWRRIAVHPRLNGAILAALGVAVYAALSMWPLPSATPARATAADPAPAVEQAQQAGPDQAAAEAHEAPAHGSEHGEEQGPQKFANAITVIVRAFPDAAWAHWLHEWEVILFSLFFAGAISLVANAAAVKREMIPGRFQAAVEYLIESGYNFFVEIIGEKHGPRFVPFLGTLFIYILCMNYAGLIPFLDSPTSSLNVTFALAITVFVYAQYVGFRELGVIGWLDHLAGNPRTFITWLMVPLMVPIHILGELAKPISLSARLFGNVFGEDMLLVAFATVGISAIAGLGLPFGLPLQVPFMFLALLTGLIQALIFTVLSTIYILLMLPHEEHEVEHEAVAQHAH